MLAFFDFEGSGLNTALDQPVQFAAVFTDEALNTSKDSNLFVRHRKDVIPSARATLVHRLSPSKLASGITEYELARQLYSLFLKQPNTTLVAYNGYSYDYPLLRHLMWRNLLPPYTLEFESGNTRWDLLNVVRAYWALRPEGLAWPVNEKGQPVFRLEALCEANGVALENAHDALSDTYGLVDLARKLKSANPKMWDYLYEGRTKQAARKRLGLDHHSGSFPNAKPVLYTGPGVGFKRNYTSVVLPLAIAPNENNKIIAVDLAQNPGWAETATPDDIWNRNFNYEGGLAEFDDRFPIVIIKTNESPVIMPLSVLGQPGANLDWDRALIEENAKAITTTNIGERIIEALGNADRRQGEHPDTRLFEGFISNKDQSIARRIHESPENWATNVQEFDDPRLADMAFYCVARNFEEHLQGEEIDRWHEYLKKRWHDPEYLAGGNKLEGVKEEVEELAETDLSDADMELLNELEDYLDRMAAEVTALD